MLPNTDDVPTHHAQFSKITAITFSIRTQFVPPKPRQLMLPRWQSVPMPEISINEYCHLGCGENKIWASWQRLHVLAKAISATMQFGTNGHLQWTVFQFHIHHRTMALLRREMISQC
jgi:hypothetical protein